MAETASSSSTRVPHQLACVRCYGRRIKCTGTGSQCTNCLQANVPCEPRQRARRTPNLRAEERLKWLEQELKQQFKIDFSEFDTGSSLAEVFASALPTQLTTPRSLAILSRPPRSGQQRHDLASTPSGRSVHSTTGTPTEDSVLGKSSVDISFARYIASFGRSFAKVSESPRQEALPTSWPSTLKVRSLTSSHRHFLLQLFLRWVNSYHPLFSEAYVAESLAPLCDQPADGEEMPEQTISQVIFYLVLANGAAYVKQAATSQNAEDAAVYEDYERAAVTNDISADTLFEAALNILENLSSLQNPSVPAIQVILLILIYASLQRSGNRQWQLSGMAMRMAVELGLHNDSSTTDLHPSQKDMRSRTFWVAYMLELTVAFNQGRPASISHRNIKASFPEETPLTVMPIYVMRQRLIQSRVIEEIYQINNKPSATPEEVVSTMQDIQIQLDNLHILLPQVYSQADTAYHEEFWDRLYYVTSGSLHSPTPLNPRPTIESLETCLHCAGHYIEGYYYLFKKTDTPVTWVALHGTLLAAFALFVIIPQETERLFARSEPELLIEKIADWIRKCSIVLTIINERLAGGTISHLEAQFEVMGKHTLKKLSTRHRERLLSWNNAGGASGDGEDQLHRQETATKLQEANIALSIFLQNRSHERNWETAAADLPVEHWLCPPPPVTLSGSTSASLSQAQVLAHQQYQQPLAYAAGWTNPYDFDMAGFPDLNFNVEQGSESATGEGGSGEFDFDIDAFLASSSNFFNGN